YVETAMSEHALAYSTEPLTHRMFVLYEAAGLGEFATYLMRSLLSEGRIRYKTVERTKDGLRPRLIEREGPTGLIVTTTAAQLHAENETRMLSVTVTDTPDQTAAILRALAMLRSDVSRDTDRWHELQNWLALGPTAVVIPYADVLAKLVPPVAVRLRRDFATVLALIRAHALLHQAGREIHDGDKIVASLEDYAAVRALIFELVAEGIEATVPPRIRKLVEALEELPGGRGGVDPRDPGVSLARLAENLKLDKASVSRRAKEAIARGYVRNLENKRGRPARLVLGDPMPNEVEILPSPERLATEVLQRCAPNPGDMHPPPPRE
ncbi:MAG: MarR family transcriptional regulator, partial [Acidobacteriota bacterium]|nr:MarR family transcriptional regulator [Acidobacteriota bacterium]